MNTSTVGVRPNHLDHLQALESAGLVGLSGPEARVRMAASERLARIRADRDLILSGIEASAAPAYPAMPASPMRTNLALATLQLPLRGYALDGEDEPTARAEPVAPDLLDGPPSDVEASPSGGLGGGAGTGAVGAGEGAQGLVAPNSTGASVTKRELAFLDDKSLSIEEKLFQFMVLMTKKADQELVATMKEIEGKRGTSGSGASGATGSSSSGSDTAPTSAGTGSDASGSSSSTEASSSGDGSGLLGDVESFVHDHAGDALAGVATALGFPELAPVGKLVGPLAGDFFNKGVDAIASAGETVFDGIRSLFLEIDDPSSADGSDGAAPASAQGTATAAQDVADAVAARVDQAVEAPAAVAAATTSATSSSGSTGSATMDEKLEMFNLERAVQKQNDMFAALSNILKSFDDTRMSIIQNLR